MDKGNHQSVTNRAANADSYVRSRPTYVGAKLAADMVGINLVMLGSEAPVDDIPRELEILNQVVQDPTIDGLILTTPQSGAYDDIVKKLLDQGHPGRHDQLLRPHDLRPLGISHTGQDAAAAAIGGEALAKCVLDSGIRRRLDHLPLAPPRSAMSRSTTASPRPSRRPWRR